MHTTTSTSTPEPRQTWQQLADEDAALEILELSDRVRELQSERDWLRDLATVGLHQLHAAHKREQRYRELIRQQTAVIKALRASLAPVASEQAERRAA